MEVFSYIPFYHLIQYLDQNLIDLIQLFEEYGFYLKYFDHSKEIAAFSLKEGSVKKEALLALKQLLKTGVDTEKIYALGTHILSRLDSNQIFYCDELGEKMNYLFKKKSEEPKVDIEDLNAYYNNLNAKHESPDEEFANYILCKKKEYKI